MNKTFYGHTLNINGLLNLDRSNTHIHNIDAKRSKVDNDGAMMTHKYRGSIVVLSISKSVEPNEEQKEMTSGFQQGIQCKQ